VGGALLAVLLALVLLWRFTPLREFATPDAVVHFFRSYRHHPLALGIVTLIYVVGGLLGFPVTVMIVATSAAFGLWTGVFYASVGSLVSAAVGYGVGRMIGAARLEHLLGARAMKIKEGVSGHGIVAVTTIRILPIAPFSVVNVAAGALSVKFTDYMVGTVFGLAPGFIMLAAAGRRVSSFMAHPTLQGGAMLAAVLAAWLALSYGLQVFMRHRARA
jgi:uncharacterized membrane protein YdjX (TVP38/TMEM64 family)